MSNKSTLRQSVEVAQVSDEAAAGSVAPELATPRVTRIEGIDIPDPATLNVPAVDPSIVPLPKEVQLSYVQRLLQVDGSTPIELKRIIDDLTNYKAAMSEPINKDTGARYQFSLFKTYIRALEVPQEVAKRAIEIVLYFLNEGAEGAFSLQNVSRYQPYIKNLTMPEILLFGKLNIFLTTIAKPETRIDQIKHYDTIDVVKNFPTAYIACAERLVQYLNSFR